MLLFLALPYFNIQVVASSHLALLTRLATEQLYKNISFVRMVSWSITRETERNKKSELLFWEGGNRSKKQERVSGWDESVCCLTLAKLWPQVIIMGWW